MKPFDIAEAFMEQHARGVPLPELRKAFEKNLQDLGIRHFACCSHVDPLNPRNAALVFQTYPADWVRASLRLVPAQFSQAVRIHLDFENRVVAAAPRGSAIVYLGSVTGSLGPVRGTLTHPGGSRCDLGRHGRGTEAFLRERLNWR